MESQHGVIFTGGDAPHPDASRFVQRPTTIIAVDSGWEHARASGAVPHVLVGDMDSILPEHLAEAERLGVEVVRHPVDKDLTDAEIALELAVEHGFTVITVVSGGGDRIDHVIGFVNAAAVHSAPDRRVDIVVGRALITIVSPGAPLTATTGAEPLVSLVPLGGPAHGVTTRGLRWELANETLAPLASRGVSNVPVATEYSVAIADGRLAVIEPYHFPGHTSHEGDT